MPIKSSNGKWKWGNIERDSKKELAQTVYGIWMKNGKKGSFSKFWHGTHESLDESNASSKIWYLGNNRSENLKLSLPHWWFPLYLAKDKSYAEDYADYGVYEVKTKTVLKDILDFNNKSDLAKLDIPQILKDRLVKPDTDLNYAMYELFRLAKNKNADLDTLDDVRRQEWIKAALEMKQKLDLIRPFVSKIKPKILEGDEWFLFLLYKMMFDAGFKGFMRKEFGNEILAVFDIENLDEISLQKCK